MLEREERGEREIGLKRRKRKREREQESRHYSNNLEFTSEGSDCHVINCVNLLFYSEIQKRGEHDMVAGGQAGAAFQSAT
jgi:hypothetical protein